jgi:hypothetical protein
MSEEIRVLEYIYFPLGQYKEGDIKLSTMQRNIEPTRGKRWAGDKKLDVLPAHW